MTCRMACTARLVKFATVVDLGIFVAKPYLESGERILFKPGANRSQGNRAIGGHLFVTNQRVIFVPNVVDRLTGAKQWACTLSEIDGVGTAARTFDKPFSGGARRRLELHLDDDRRELFVVNHVEAVEENLRKTRVAYRAGRAQAG
jgi:hypothetical protein